MCSIISFQMRTILALHHLFPFVLDQWNKGHEFKFQQLISWCCLWFNQIHKQNLLWTKMEYSLISQGIMSIFLLRIIIVNSEGKRQEAIWSHSYWLLTICTIVSLQFQVDLLVWCTKYLIFVNIQLGKTVESCSSK